METYTEIVDAVEKVIRSRIATMGVISPKQLFESAVELTDDFESQAILWARGGELRDSYNQFAGYPKSAAEDCYERAMQSDYEGARDLVRRGLVAAMESAIGRVDSVTGEREIFGEMFLIRSEPAIISH